MPYMLKRNDVSGELFDTCQRFNIAPGEKTIKQIKTLEAVGKAKGIAGVCDPRAIFLLMVMNGDSFEEPMPRPAPEVKTEPKKPETVKTEEKQLNKAG